MNTLDFFLGMVADGAFVEDIAAALNRPINSIRGKALSFLRTGEIGAIPKQRESNAASKVDALADLGDISGMNVADIADTIGKTEDADLPQLIMMVQHAKKE